MYNKEMMNTMRNKGNLALTLIFLLMSVSSWGQDKINTPAAFEKMKDRSLWQKTSNAAGLQLDDPIDYTEIGVAFQSYEGSFHRPQEGESGNSLNFNAEGAVFVGKVYAWGKFKYDRQTIKDAGFNASIIDPFRGMPYMVADTNKSEWRNQVYDMSFKVSTPKYFDKLSLGIEGGYKAISGAKQRDPRTENYFYTFHLKPGAVYSVNDQHHIGVNLDYFNLKEISEMSNVNTYYDQIYYKMYGLGMSVQGVGSGRATDYNGNSIGGSIQYGYKGNVNLLFSTDYAYRVEDVIIDGTYPRDEASVKDKMWNTKLQLYTTKGRLTHLLTFNYINQHMDGIEAVTKFENDIYSYTTLYKDIRSQYKTQTATLDYDVTIDREKEYDWKFGVGVKYINKEDAYLIPRSEKTSENLAFQGRAKKNFALSNNALMKRLLIGADYSYSKNLSGRYDYNGSNPQYIVVREFEQIDSNYLNSSYWSIGASATYSQKINKTMRTSLYAKADFRYTKAVNTDFSGRRVIQLSVGCNF